MPQLKLASQSAGKRLAFILVLLLLPVAALLYLVADRSLSDMRLIQRQSAGAGYLQRLMPVYAQLAGGEQPAANLIAGIRTVPPVIGDPNRGLMLDAETVATQLTRPGSDGVANLWRLRSLIHDTALSSDLMLESARDRHFLANAAAADLPDLVLFVRRTTGERGAAEGEFAMLRNAAFAAISAAVKSNTAGAMVNELNGGLTRLDAAAGHYVEALRSADGARTGEAGEALIGTANTLAALSLDALEVRITEQHNKLRTELLLILVAVGFATVFALGVAAHLVRATFRKLDVVEAARQGLEKSEADARALAAELQALNSEIAGLNRELSHNYKVLQDTQQDNIEKSKMAQLGSLTAMVAHELRNPLGAIRNTNFHIETLSRKNNWALGRQLDRIGNAVIRCDAIITQLLNYATSNDVHLEDIDLSQWLPSALREEARDLPGWLAIDFEDGACGIRTMVDPVKLRQSLGNILLNAAQALAPGLVPGSGLSRAVQVSSRLHDGGVAIAITDDGPGIPADKLPMVTEPLFTTKSFGPGLGLAIVDQVVRLHGGRLSIQSEAGKGTTVSIWLPRAVAEAKAA